MIRKVVAIRAHWGLCLLDYKSFWAAVMICATLVDRNTHTHTHTHADTETEQWPTYMISLDK